MAEASRALWIDALKGWGMLLIVIGHVWSLNDVSLIYVWMFSFHVPLFFFAAGLTLKYQGVSLSAFLKRRMHTLLLPYLLFALLGYLFYLSGYVVAQLAGLQMAQFDYGLWRPLLGVFYASVGDGMLVNSPLWFLVALFLAQTWVLALQLYVTAAWQRYAVLGVLFALAAWIEESISLPFSVLPAMGAAIFIQWGIAFRQRNLLERVSERTALGMLLLLFAITLFSPLNGAVGLAGPTINQPLLFILFALAGTGLSVLLVRLVPSSWQTMLAFVGRYSMGILVTHMLVIKGVKVILSLLTGTGLEVMEHSFLWGVLVLALTGLLIWPLVYGLERWFGWSLGR